MSLNAASKQNHGFGLMEIIIVLAVIGLIGGGSWYWRGVENQKTIQQIGVEKIKEAQALKQKVDKQTKALQKEMDAANADNPPVSGSVDTSNWKTYRNEKYGFEVKYPNDWVGNPQVLVDLEMSQGISETNLDDRYLSILYKPGKGYCDHGVGCGFPAQIQILTCNRCTLESTASRYNSLKEDEDVVAISTENFLISGHHARRIMLELIRTGMAEVDIPYLVVLVENSPNTIVKMQARAWTRSSNYKSYVTSIFETMLSTFKLIK